MGCCVQTKLFLQTSFFAVLFGCANLNSFVGVYHEHIELKSSIRNLDNNALKTLAHFLDEKIRGRGIFLRTQFLRLFRFLENHLWLHQTSLHRRE